MSAASLYSQLAMVVVVEGLHTLLGLLNATAPLARVAYILLVMSVPMSDLV